MAPGRLEAVDERLDAITRLKRKYGDSEEAMLALREQVAGELERLGAIQLDGDDEAVGRARDVERLIAG